MEGLAIPYLLQFKNKAYRGGAHHLLKQDAPGEKEMFYVVYERTVLYLYTNVRLSIYSTYSRYSSYGTRRRILIQSITAAGISLCER
jgi:hypothetical protein